MTKLYVGNLPYSFNDAKLMEIFAPFGAIASATVIMDRNTGRSKGFGFVEMEDDGAAQTAMSEMNGKDFDGRALVVNEARPMADKPRFDRNRR